MSQLRELVDATEDLSIRDQCELLGVARSTLYYEGFDLLEALAKGVIVDVANDGGQSGLSSSGNGRIWQGMAVAYRLHME